MSLSLTPGYSSRGFTLLEVLVALLVLSVGLLGLAALQTLGLKFNTQSYQRTQATLLLDDMIERMRSNPDGVANGDYDTLLKTPVSASSPPSLKADCAVVTCNAADMAVYDMNQWLNSMSAIKLASAQGQIVSKPPLYTITVMWSENNLTMFEYANVQLK